MKYLIFILIFVGCIQKKNTVGVSKAGVTIVAPSDRGVLGLDLRVGNMEWTRGCENRIGNLTADAYAWRAKVDIGFNNGGDIRHDTGVDLIPKGTVFTRTILESFMPFDNELLIINMNGYRLKQALEGGVNKLLTNKTASITDDNDADGPQHGNCYGVVGDLDGSGRFLNVSSRLKISVNPLNIAQVVIGSASNKTLQVTTEGRRVTEIYFDGIKIYSNPSGDPIFGWESGNSSCVVKGIPFNQSQACRFFSVAISEFYASGGDENPSFDPEMQEISGDGSVISTGKKMEVDDKNAILEYILNFSTYYPRIEGRINMP